jgi:sterol 3beta-glucosyltransferase
MNTTILTYGSRGDFQPFLALSLALQKAGHVVTLAGPECFAGLATSRAVPYVSLPGDPVELSIAFNQAESNPLGMVAAMRRHVLEIAPGVIGQAIQASQNADLLIHSFAFTTGAHSLARHLGIPDISIQTFPVFTPTGDYPVAAFPNLGRMGNQFTHWLAAQIFWMGGNAGFKQIQHLLPDSFPKTLSWPFAHPHEQLCTPLLLAVSPSVLPPPADLPAHVSISGYFFLEEEHYQPPDSLAEFLEAGSSPICVSFGSMVHDHAERTGRTLLDVFSRGQERAVILTGWGGWKADPVPGNILYLESVPHSWLLPRCKIIVHHGGAGTTAAGLRAGIPNIVIPHAADQPFWGRRVQALGAGPAPIPIKKLTAPRLLAALAEAASPTVLAAAHALGLQIRAEDGLGLAVRRVEQEKARVS